MRGAPELWEPLRPLYEAGDYAGAADRGREALDAHPGYPDLLYNVACCESLAGRPDDAVEHLAQAIEIWDGFRAMAREDSDFDSIRGEPGYVELVSR
jgi:tetratricopeptide (TPR) repeat protein